MTDPTPNLAERLREHELKTDAPVFEAVRQGHKTWEIRRNDRDFRVGDRLTLRETAFTGAEMQEGKPLVYTGRTLTVGVTFVLEGPVYGLADGWAILSIRALSAQGAAPSQGEPTREQIARECYAVGEFDEVYDPEKHDQWWNEDGDAAGLALQYIELADRIRALYASPSQPQQKEVEGQVWRPGEREAIEAEHHREAERESLGLTAQPSIGGYICKDCGEYIEKGWFHGCD